jgi:hypothetical protein
MPANQGPEQWRALAAEALALAQELTDPAAKQAILMIAQRYMELAERAEQREKDDGSE